MCLCLCALRRNVRVMILGGGGGHRWGAPQGSHRHLDNRWGGERAKAHLWSTRPRCVPGVRGHGPSSNALRAARTAVSTSAASASATLMITSSVYTTTSGPFASGHDGRQSQAPYTSASGCAAAHTTVATPPLLGGGQGASPTRECSQWAAQLLQGAGAPGASSIEVDRINK